MALLRKVIIKAATSQLDWPIIYTLTGSETISTSTWTIVPVETGGLGVVGGSPAIAANVTSCILSGGLYRAVYTVVNTVTTNQSRTYVQSFDVRIGPVEAV